MTKQQEKSKIRKFFDNVIAIIVFLIILIPPSVFFGLILGSMEIGITIYVILILVCIMFAIMDYFIK